MRSVIYSSDSAGIAEIVAQQFDVGRQDIECASNSNNRA